MFLWSKELFLTTSLLSSFSSFTSHQFALFFNEQAQTSWITKGAVAAGAVAIAYQWYEMKNLKRKVDKIKYENMYFKNVLCLIIFGIEDYPLVRNYWRRSYSIQASRLRIKMVLKDLNRYYHGKEVALMGKIIKKNKAFLDKEIELS